jgi:hypothetical protein
MKPLIMSYLVSDSFLKGDNNSESFSSVFTLVSRIL